MSKTESNEWMRWFINEDGGVYEFDLRKQAFEFPNDHRTPYATEKAAEAAAADMEAVSAEARLTVPTVEMVGRVARVKFASDGRDERAYVAEVRTDFGDPHWSGSWHGFGLPKGKGIEVIEWVTPSSEVTDALVNMLDLASLSMDVLFGPQAEQAEKEMAKAKAILERLR